MRIRLPPALLPLVVFFAAAWLSLFSKFADLPAFAASGGGTILGTFFVETSPPAAVPAYPGEIPSGAKLPAGAADCEKAIANASAGQQLPPGLLGAIAVVESGRLDPQTGGLKPWPWTIDANGTGYVYASLPSAIAAAAAFEAMGIGSLDVGCLQVNLAQHPDAFSSLAEAFDPAANADYAAAFLTSLYQKFGNWPQAVAAYHSQTPAVGAPYAAKVYAAWQGAGSLPDGGAAAAVATLGALPGPMRNAMPPFDLTSLMPPMARLLPPVQALDNRSLASYRAAPVAIASRLVPRG